MFTVSFMLVNKRPYCIEVKSLDLTLHNNTAGEKDAK